MSDRGRVLVIDDEEGMRYTLGVLLKKKGYEVTTVENGRAGLDALDAYKPDYILCDLRMPEMDGLTLLREVMQRGFSRPVIMMSAYGTVDEAVEAMRLGAYDYIGKPFKSDEVLLVLERAAERQELREENIRLREASIAAADREILTDDPAMKNLLAMVRKIAAFKSTVLIAGESGTGKELFARSIHRNSPRASGPFVAINCGAIPEHLLESELFGHAKGAFTDAVAHKIGLVAASTGGTLFLDEVGELPLMLQVKLLRVLQEEKVRPVGANEEIEVDLRVVAATARDLEEQVAGGRFREDLYYRLNVFHLRVPPLRQRPADIPLLANHLIVKIAQRYGLHVPPIDPEALAMLGNYHWPGNVRELENAVEQAVVLAANETITARHLPEHIREASPTAPPSQSGDLSIKRNFKNMEKRLIAEALALTNGNKSRAAKLLEISVRALIYKIQDYGLEETKDRATGD